MDRTFLLLVLVLVLHSTSLSQTLLYTKKESQGAIIFAGAFDIDKVESDGPLYGYEYGGFVKEDSIIIYNIQTGTNEFEGKLPQLFLSAKRGLVYAYKNLYQSDNKWSFICWYYNENNEQVLEFYKDGKSVFNKIGTSMPALYKLNGKIFMSTTTIADTVLTMYSIRTDLATNTLINYEKIKTAQIIQRGGEFIVMIPIQNSGRITWKLIQINGSIIRENEETITGDIALVRVSLDGLRSGEYIFAANNGSETFVNYLKK